jgi:rhodanese-related sulfurtransferase
MADLFKRLLLLLVVACTLALAVNAVSPRGIPLVGQWDTDKGVVTADTDLAAVWMEFELSDPATAKQVFDARTAVFVDVRSREPYAAGHIPGAVSLPMGEFDALVMDLVADLAPDHPIVTYCSGRLCQDSHTAAQWLMELGFENVVVFIDGFPGWEENGYPVETS